MLTSIGLVSCQTAQNIGVAGANEDTKRTIVSFSKTMPNKDVDIYTINYSDNSYTTYYNDKNTSILNITSSRNKKNDILFINSVDDAIQLKNKKVTNLIFYSYSTPIYSYFVSKDGFVGSHFIETSTNAPTDKLNIGDDVSIRLYPQQYNQIRKIYSGGTYLLFTGILLPVQEYPSPDIYYISFDFASDYSIQTLDTII